MLHPRPLHRVLRPRSNSVNFAGVCKVDCQPHTLSPHLSVSQEILGTAQSVGCTIDGCTPQEVMEQINDGELEVPDE